MRHWSILMAVAVFGSATVSTLAAQQPTLMSMPVPALEGQCSAGQSASCDELSGRYRAGRTGVVQDDAKSARYKLLACEAGDARSCGVYAAYVSGNRAGYPQNDPAIKAKYARLGCVGGDGLSCGLASAIANNTGSYSELERAEIYANVCTIGETADCEKAAYAEGNRENWSVAADLARKACAMGAQSSCSNVAAYTVREDNAARAQAAQVARATQKQAPQSNQQDTSSWYQPRPSQSSGSVDNGRSGREPCTTSNGNSGTSYWYYGFNNQRVDGPCI